MLTFPNIELLGTIEQFCQLHKLDYIDGITTFCEKNNVEIELVAELIKHDPVFTAKLQIAAENLNFVKKSGAAKLPL